VIGIAPGMLSDDRVPVRLHGLGTPAPVIDFGGVPLWPADRARWLSPTGK
jgi:hypothetical protein